MTRLFHAIAAALVLALAILAQPAAAHGGEKHGAAKAPVQTETPAASAQDGEEPASPSSEAQEEPRADSEHASSGGSVLTRLHPATVHFPIALLIVAALVEMLAMARSSGPLAQAANVMTVAGAAGAVIAALFGWIHTGIWFGGDSTMHWHRWTGTGLALAAPLAALLAFRADRRAFRIVIVLIAAALVAQGYWGAELAQGPDHLGLGI
ncbi:hypothetical protein A3736_12480 [Erythrobacter sp. HI0063]|jgi:uncharacterized membrane protein|uniref:DUF2231 domain-containing protein n=1 Tax=unclassified Erythrobacter TaxID=2633097 RepID=UPI0007C27B72|nr:MULTISPECIES: DUF2231 domain-containing protein [unclassified Erythrobacter]KZY55006.1 hypothetical protein A3736_12480 [Erythrobacter sp. HI0063]MBO9512424.1 hypothetical protein [Erythrobacter sp. A6_0]|tara:strand:- start:673 stop:1299 length:627 start_codon:yes stop_codon:yes gene_type:complete